MTILNSAAVIVENGASKKKRKEVGLADNAALNQSTEGRLGVWSSYLTRISRDYSFI